MSAGGRGVKRAAADAEAAMARRQNNRFVIASFQQPVQPDPAYADDTWATLRHAIIEINRRNTSDLSYEQLYRYSYNMVLHKHGDYLYNGLSNLLTEHLREVAVQINAASPPAFLAEIRTQWSWFEVSLGLVRDVLMYMDRTYVKNKQKKTVHELGVSLFRDFVVRDDTILPRLVDSLLGTIDRERNGEAIDTHLIRSITRMLAELGNDDNGNSVYVNVFEDGFLERTRQFYAREGQLYLSETTCSDYLRKANQRICEERMRVELYLEAQTAPKVRKVAENELISKYMKTLVEMENSGLIWMLRNDKVDDLHLMYTLFRSIDDGDDELRSNLKAEVLERGNALVQDSENVLDPVALVNSILALKEKYNRILDMSFHLPPGEDAGGATEGALGASAGSTVGGFGGAIAQSSLVSSPALVVAPTGMGGGGGLPSSVAASAPTRVPDRKFSNAVNEAFERFINSFPRAAEYISLYVDKLLRKDCKGTSDDEVETKLDSIMTLFRYLHEKDIFERYYKQHLTKRLLYSRSASSDAERSFISKIKNECGYMYTSKMEVMFNDMRTSEETTKSFKAKVSREGIDMMGIDLNVSVLTTMSWPITETKPCNLPASTVHCTTMFENFYFGNHDGRRIRWQTGLGMAELRANFGGGTRTVDLSVPSYSMCVLMLFNDCDQMTYRQIADATAIPGSELVRNLQSLSLAKYRVLNKEPRTKEVNPDDVFSFNDDFTCRNRRIKIQMISAQRESETEKRQTRHRIDDDRKPLIEAAIVRIMKHRKVLEHNTLIVEVTTQLSSRFEPNPLDIKMRIESLVEREFLERQADKRQVYQYVA